MDLENLIKIGIISPLGIALGSFFNYISTSGFCISYKTNDYSIEGLVTLGIVDVYAAVLLYTNLKQILKSNSSLIETS